jgi:hypothetical protein
LIKTKWGIIIEDLTNIMSAKIGFNWPSSSEEKIKMWNVKDLMTTDNGRKMIANAHLIFEVKFSPHNWGYVKMHTYNDSMIDKLINKRPHDFWQNTLYSIIYQY